MSDGLTTKQVIRELNRLKGDDPDAAADLYRRAVGAGCDFKGLASSLLRLQRNGDDLMRRLAEIKAAHDAPAPPRA